MGRSAGLPWTLITKKTSPIESSVWWRTERFDSFRCSENEDELDEDELCNANLGTKTVFPESKSILQPIPPPVSQWHDGTRTWMQKRFDDSVKNQTSKVMILAGEKGIGKTALYLYIWRSICYNTSTFTLSTSRRRCSYLIYQNFMISIIKLSLNVLILSIPQLSKQWVTIMLYKWKWIIICHLLIIYY